MTAPFDQDDEPTAMFVPTWDDDRGAVEPDDGAAPADGAELPPEDEEPVDDEPVEDEPVEDEPVVDAVDEAAVDADDEPVLDEEPTVDAAEEPVVDEEPAVEDEPVTVVAATEPVHDETGPGTLRPVVPEPVVEARRARSTPPAVAPSPGRRAWDGLRAATGLLVLVVFAGAGLAAAIGLVVLGIAFALQQAVGD